MDLHLGIRVTHQARGEHAARSKGFWQKERGRGGGEEEAARQLHYYELRVSVGMTA